MSDFKFGGEANIAGQKIGIDGSFDTSIFRPIQNKRPKPRVLSSSTTINLTYGSEIIPIGEVDNFSAKKAFKVVKKFKPYGAKEEMVITEDAGWDLSFSGGKVDWRLAYLIYATEIAMIGVDSSNLPNVSPNGISGYLYNKPMFSVVHKTYHYDGTIETYIYEDVTLLEYSTTAQNDNQEIIESLSAFSPYRTIGEEMQTVSNELKLISGVVDSIVQILSRTNWS